MVANCLLPVGDSDKVLIVLILGKCRHIFYWLGLVQRNRLMDGTSCYCPWRVIVGSSVRKFGWLEFTEQYEFRTYWIYSVFKTVTPLSPTPSVLLAADFFVSNGIPNQGDHLIWLNCQSPLLFCFKNVRTQLNLSLKTNNITFLYFMWSLL